MNLLRRLAAIPRDKLLHASAGFVIGALSFRLGWLLAGLLVVSAGLLKEVYDDLRYGAFDWRDALATLLGGALALLNAHW